MITTSKVYVLLEIEQELLVDGSLAFMGGVDKYELKDVRVIGIYNDRKVAEEDLKKYETKAPDNIIYSLQVSCLFKKEKKG